MRRQTALADQANLSDGWRELNQSHGKTNGSNWEVLRKNTSGRHSGSSGQSGTLMDIDGDGYLDILNYTKRGLRYLPGSGDGFAPESLKIYKPN